jgi:hypothetical protein
LPPELTLDPSTGKITGIPLPASVGPHQLSIKVADGLLGEYIKPLDLTINP